MSDFESRREDAKREAWEDAHASVPEPDSPSRCGSAWRLTGQAVFGDDADGRRGAPLYVWNCAKGCCEREVLG